MADRPKIDEFVFVLLAGLILIIVFMVGFPSLPGNTADNQSVNVSDVSTGDVSRFIDLGDFTVSYSVGTETLDSKSNLDVFKGYFSEQNTNLLGDISNDKLAILRGASLTLVIDGVTNNDNVIIMVNGQEAATKKLDVGTNIVPIDVALLKTSNVISIQTTYSSWKFWSKSYYHIKSAKFEIQYQGSSFKSFNFYLDDKEFNKFKYSNLDFKLNTEGASATNSLIIDINGNSFYRATPPLLTFTQEVPKAFFKLGANVITFSADPGATYNLQDTKLTVIREG